MQYEPNDYDFGRATDRGDDEPTVKLRRQIRVTPEAREANAAWQTSKPGLSRIEFEGDEVRL